MSAEEVRELIKKDNEVRELLDEIEYICGAMGPKGKPCVREPGHPGCHCDEGVDLGPALVGDGRAKRYQTWENREER